MPTAMPGRWDDRDSRRYRNSRAVRERVGCLLLNGLCFLKALLACCCHLERLGDFLPVKLNLLFLAIDLEGEFVLGFWLWWGRCIIARVLFIVIVGGFGVRTIIRMLVELWCPPCMVGLLVFVA